MNRHAGARLRAAPRGRDRSRPYNEGVITTRRSAGSTAGGTVEAWGRATDNPVGGWYGLKKGLRGRFGVYLPPLLEVLGLAELTHDARNNRMRAV